jgi:hypothetical protein
VGGGNLGFLRQIYFGRLVSFWLYGFRFLVPSRAVSARMEMLALDVLTDTRRLRCFTGL